MNRGAVTRRPIVGRRSDRSRKPHERRNPRIARGDAEGNYRRAMLLYQLLEDYFRAQDRWYLGPKASFAWLAAHDPAAYRAFQAALAPGAELAAVAALARRVQERL